MANSSNFDEALSGPEAELAHQLISGLGSVDVSRYTVVGRYTRFDEPVLNALKDARQRIVAGLDSPGQKRENHLIWAAPGSGKTFLVQQIAESLGTSVRYHEINLAKCTEADFASALTVLEGEELPVLCLIDEADAKPDASWPYEMLLPYLDGAVERGKPWVFVLAGSSGQSRSEMKARIAGRPKGSDLLSRVPVQNEYDIAGFSLGDRVLVVLSQLSSAARSIGREVTAVEKLGLLYVALIPYLANARQLGEFASRAAERMLPSDDRLKYDNLFAPGDPENKNFWSWAHTFASDLEGAYVSLAVPAQRSDVAPAPAPSDALARLPSEELTEPSTSAQAPVRHPFDRTPFIGRSEEQMVLHRLLDDAAAGRGSLAMVSGEAGVGKTRIAEELADAAREQGMFVGVGHCYEMEGAPPYVPFVEFIEQLSRSLAPADFRRALGDQGAQVTQLAPKLRQTLPPLAESPELPPEQARYYMFSGACDFWEECARNQPTLLILEDFHWADESSCLLLEHLAQRLANMAVLVVCTYRATEVGRAHPLTRTLEHLSRRPGTQRLALRPFGKEDVEALLVALSGRQPPSELVSLLFGETEGVPFFIEEVYRHLVDEGLLFDAAGEWRSEVSVGEIEVPDSVRMVVGRRLDRVGATTRQVLTQAAAVGRGFTLDFLRALIDEEEDVLLDSLDEAEQQQLLRSLEGPEPTFAFSHELVRQTLLAEVTAVRRQRLHQRVARAIEETYVDSLDEHLADLAYHLSHSGQAERAVEYLSRAGEDAARRFASSEALGYFQRALDLEPTGMRRDRILAARAKLLLSLFRGKDAAPDLEELLELARRRTDRTTELAALLDLGSAYYTIAIDDPSAASKSHRALEQAYELAKTLGDKAGMARSLIARRHLVDFEPDYLPRLTREMEEAIQLSQEVGDEDLILSARLAALRIAATPDTDDALAEAESILDALERRGNLVDLNAHLFHMMWGYYYAARFEDCVATCDRGFLVAGQIGVPPVQYASIKGLALIDLARFGDAWASLQQEIADDEHRLGRANRDAGVAAYLTAVMAFEQAEAAALNVIAEGEALVRPWVIRFGKVALGQSLIALGKIRGGSMSAIRDELEAQGAMLDSTDNRLHVARALLANDLYADALAILEQGLDGTNDATFGGFMAASRSAGHFRPVMLLLKAQALLGLGRAREALDEANDAYQVGYGRLIGEIQAARGQAYQELGDELAALECYRDAAARLRAMAESIPDPVHRDGFLANPAVSAVLLQGDGT